MMYVGQQRSEAGMLARLARRQRHRSRTSPVKRALEGDHRRAPRCITRQLDGPFDCLGSRVGQEDALLGRPGGHLGQTFAERRHPFVVEVGTADVEEVGRRVLDRLHHVRMSVPGRGDRDARHEVQIAIAVDVLHHHPLAAGDGEGILLDVAVRGPRRIAFDDSAGLGPRWGNNDFGIVAVRHGLGTP